MPEAVAILLDTSDFVRNGDMLPTRFLQQEQAVNSIIEAKTHSNIENTLSISTASSPPRLLCPMTSDSGFLLTSMHGVLPNGRSDFVRGLLQARLSLKHRPRRNAAPSVVAFVGSPLPAEQHGRLRDAARLLRKEGIGLSAVLFGVDAVRENLALCRELVAAADKGGNSHLVVFNPAVNSALADVLICSPLLQGASGAAPPPAPGAAQYESDIDRAIRLSMQDMPAQPAQPAQPAPPADSIDGIDFTNMSEDEVLRAVIEFSRREVEQAPSAVAAPEAEVASETSSESASEPDAPPERDAAPAEPVAPVEPAAPAEPVEPAKPNEVSAPPSDDGASSSDVEPIRRDQVDFSSSMLQSVLAKLNITADGLAVAPDDASDERGDEEMGAPE
eukprot:gnl/Chilomastix_cuspidata/897.p1 GENE.gnl/Chilomastix_cuspidata/897~~gnl/Chilomastix_cuspidata/897.p1  ORF type:complete len:389 (+),score=142.81 gnl/Chilomastix_cuspidata/897:207-1373(+)